MPPKSDSKIDLEMTLVGRLKCDKGQEGHLSPFKSHPSQSPAHGSPARPAQAVSPSWCQLRKGSAQDSICATLYTASSQAQPTHPTPRSFTDLLAEGLAQVTPLSPWGDLCWEPPPAWGAKFLAMMRSDLCQRSTGGAAAKVTPF